MSPNFDPARADETTRLVVEAVNIGRRSVTLNAGGLLHRDGTLGMFSGDGVPKTYPIILNEGQSGSTWVTLFSYRDSLKRDPPNRAFFRSETGKIYTTKLSKNVLKVLRGQ